MPPKAKPPVDKYAATQWGGEMFHDLMVPSGQLCQVRRPGAEGLMRVGLLDKVKGLSALVDDKHLKRVKGGKSGAASDLARELVNNPDEAMTVMNTIDKIVKYVVIQPQLELPFKTSPDGKDVSLQDNERLEGQIYTDQISIEDRMFIFQYAVGGSSDVERFRRESSQSLAGFQDGGDISLPSL